MSDLTKPLQSLINSAAQLPDSKQLKPYAQRINPSSRAKVSATSCILLDVSASMNEWVGTRRKIELLRIAVDRPLADSEAVFVFSSIVYQIPSFSVIPDGDGGTALHMALDKVLPLRPHRTLVVSDGKPDDERQALASAKKLTGTINTLFIGNDNDKDAIAFMQKLARLGCGLYHHSKLEDGPIALAESIQLLLPQTGH